MPRSPKSRGKGGRRFPKREGGARRSKAVAPQAIGRPQSAKSQSQPVAIHGSPRVGAWRELTPVGLGEHAAKHTWRFALYSEGRSQRPDGKEYLALLFRDEDRETFGIREWLGPDQPHYTDLRSIARRVVTDEAYRASLQSDDPDLPTMWRRR